MLRWPDSETTCMKAVGPMACCFFNYMTLTICYDCILFVHCYNLWNGSCRTWSSMCTCATITSVFYSFLT